MPPKSRHQRRNSLSEEEIANLMKAHYTQSSAAESKNDCKEDGSKASSAEQVIDDEGKCRGGTAKKTVSFGETTIITIPNREDIAEERNLAREAAHEEYVADIMLNLRHANDASTIHSYSTATLIDCNEEGSNNTVPLTLRSRSGSFYIPPNQTLDIIDEDNFEDDEDLPFALNPSAEEGAQWMSSFIYHDKNA